MRKLRWKISKRFWQFMEQLNNYMLFRCVNCSRIRFEKDKIMVQHRTGKWVPLCRECYEQIYHPWSEDNE
jgi:NAD-dependent SIR2 family protein deacetylase